MTEPPGITRRDFLKTTGLAGAAALIHLPAVSAPPAAYKDVRLVDGWEHYRGSLGGVWEVWNGSGASIIHWRSVQVPHCFNARDAVDPDESLYRGQGWYRTRLKVQNPFTNGRTLLHFEGAGQRTRIFVGPESVGHHVGGYDEFVVDITDAALRVLSATDSKGTLPLAVVCDNSRDLETIPSDFSDFNLYGGLYRYVNLVYAPAVSLERVHIACRVQARG